MKHPDRSENDPSVYIDPDPRTFVTHTVALTTVTSAAAFFFLDGPGSARSTPEHSEVRSIFTPYAETTAHGLHTRCSKLLKLASSPSAPSLDGSELPASAATNDFRSLKENAYWAGCFQGETPQHLRVESRGDVTIHASPAAGGQVDLNVYNFWQFPRLSWGHYTGPQLSTDWVLLSGPDRLPPDQKISCARTPRPPK